MHLPFLVSEYTDFYAGRHHATNIGTMFRGAENALPRFAPSARFDLELELGAIFGTDSFGPVTVDEANQMIFGYVLLNDWSARDIQAWEYQPLGPFQAKATATSISPWIITKAALEPFRCDSPEREFELLPHLRDTGPMLYDINLEVSLAPQGKTASTITRTNYREMYYSSAQQLAHHTTTFNDDMTVYLGKRRIDLMHLGRAHTAGDIVIHVPDQNVMFTGDIVEYNSACYCGDGYFFSWGDTLDNIASFDVDAIAPGRGTTLVGKAMVETAIENTHDFVDSTYRPAARNGSLKEAWDSVRAACDPKFSDYAIYEHCLPFNVARAYDEARGIETPRIWTTQRDLDMWDELQALAPARPI